MWDNRTERERHLGKKHGCILFICSLRTFQAEKRSRIIRSSGFLHGPKKPNLGLLEAAGGNITIWTMMGQKKLRQTINCAVEQKILLWLKNLLMAFLAFFLLTLVNISKLRSVWKCFLKVSFHTLRAKHSMTYLDETFVGDFSTLCCLHNFLSSVILCGRELMSSASWWYHSVLNAGKASQKMKGASKWSLKLHASFRSLPLAKISGVTFIYREAVFTVIEEEQSWRRFLSFAMVDPVQYWHQGGKAHNNVVCA